MQLYGMGKGIVTVKNKILDSLYLYCILTVIIPVIIVKSLGLLQPIELAYYDFLFYLNPLEKTDERIVIVEYDEKSIQLLKEATISDRTLVSLLNKIIEQKPQIIGLDLYRNFAVPAPEVTKQLNTEAYKSLNAIFANYPNIIGIEKIIKPTVAAPPILKRQEMVAASDLPIDSDSRIRRAYMFPTVDYEGNPTQIPYIGVALGYEYLARDGWSADNVPKGLKFFKHDQSIVLYNLAKKLPVFFGDDPGWDFLVNWRKTQENNNFQRISASQLLENSVDSDLFRDRLVIIGNTTSYGDIHQTPLIRWKRNTWTDGVEIVAQVASSIISAAIEQRNLINPAPFAWSFFLLLCPVIAIAKIADNKVNRSNRFSSTKLQLATVVYSLLFCFLIGFISLTGFRLGLWIDVTLAFVGIFWCYIVVNKYYQSKKEKDNLRNLILIVKDLNHNLGNGLRSISSSNRSVVRSGQEIIHEIENDLEINGMSELKISETNFSSSINKLFNNTKNIQRETLRIASYKKRTSEFLKYTYLNENTIAEKGGFNEIIEQTVKSFLAQNEYSYQVDIKEQYDKSLKNYRLLYIEALEILIESLLDNAFFAVDPRLNQRKEYLPKITIKTVNAKKSIQITIKDNGSGIPKKYQKNIFLPYITFKDGRGRGIGLYLVSQIVKHWKGSLVLESEINKGSCFIISLPKLKLET